MKQILIFSFLCIVLSIVYSGCSIPKMILIHRDQIENTYESIFLVKIGLFEDNRQDDERDENRIAINSPWAIIWSGSTSPEMMLFFQQSLIEEAERSRIFVVNDESKLELSGYVTSMKVDRRGTSWGT